MNFTQNMIIEHCCSCGMAFAMTTQFHDQRRNNGRSFCCPAGHSQHYSESNIKKKNREIQQLKEQLQQKENALRYSNNQINHLESSRRALKGANTKLKKKYGEIPEDEQ